MSRCMTISRKHRAVLACAASTLGAIGAWSCHERGAAGPLPVAAYVWQRHWTPEVSAAVREAPSQVGRLIVLAAQVDWTVDRPVITRVAPDYGALRACGRPVGLALRVAVCPHALPVDGPGVGQLCTLGRALIASAREAGIDPAELQLDYDCPESRLMEYARWVARLRAELRPTPVRVTGLPAWLGQSACSDLVRAVDGLVLQVHGLQPSTPDRVIDPEQARRAVRAAGRLGMRFDVALPTYGYWVGRRDQGSLYGVSAEGPMPNWPREVTRVERVRSAPDEVSKLVREWMEHRPAGMQGVIWYRLPVEGDTMNWAPATWAAVMRGEVPEARPRTVLEWRNAALADVTVTNAGNDEVPLAALEVHVDVGRTHVAAMDGLAGFVPVRGEAGSIRFVPRDAPPRGILRPAERRVIGWIRVVPGS